jgi:hypothetical protein
MNYDRCSELLAYAQVCFENCTSPFATVHLIKKKITADECKDLSYLIREIIADYTEYYPNIKVIMEKAKREFMETQT